MDHYNNMDDWLINNFQEFLDTNGGYNSQFTSVTYKEYLAKFSNEKHFERIKLLENFIDSKEYSMQKKHYIEN